jgi:hypothetical protein
MFSIITSVEDTGYPRLSVYSLKNKRIPHQKMSTRSNEKEDEEVGCGLHIIMKAILLIFYFSTKVEGLLTNAILKHNSRVKIKNRNIDGFPIIQE